MDENEWTVINVRRKTKELFDSTITKNMDQDEGVKSLLDFWIRYKNVVNK